MQSSIQIRTAKTSDATEIADIYLESRKQLMPFATLAHSDDEVRHWIKENLITKGNVTVAIVDQKIVGMCATSHKDKISWVDQLYVKPDYIQKGIGSALLSDAVTRSTLPIRLYTFQENQLAKRFYEKYGFVAIQFSDGSSNEEGVPDVLYELS